MRENFLTNEELVAMVKQKDDEAFEILLDRFSKFIYFKCGSIDYEKVGFDYADILQECEICLYKASLSFDETLGYQFVSYFKSALDITLQRTFKNAHKQNLQQAKKDYISYDYDLQLEQNDCFKVNETPESYLIYKESKEILLEFINNSLSSQEKECLNLFISGSSYEKIAIKLGMSKKSVSASLYRARKKLSKMFNLDELVSLADTYN